MKDYPALIIFALKDLQWILNTSLYYLSQAAEARVPPQPAICPFKMIRLHNWGHDLRPLSLCTLALCATMPTLLVHEWQTIQSYVTEDALLSSSPTGEFQPAGLDAEYRFRSRYTRQVLQHWKQSVKEFNSFLFLTLSSKLCSLDICKCI